jgi:hypothetical protein
MAKGIESRWELWRKQPIRFPRLGHPELSSSRPRNVYLTCGGLTAEQLQCYVSPMRRNASYALGRQYLVRWCYETVLGGDHHNTCGALLEQVAACFSSHLCSELFSRPLTSRMRRERRPSALAMRLQAFFGGGARFALWRPLIALPRGYLQYTTQLDARKRRARLWQRNMNKSVLE